MSDAEEWRTEKVDAMTIRVFGYAGSFEDLFRLPGWPQAVSIDSIKLHRIWKPGEPILIAIDPSTEETITVKFVCEILNVLRRNHCGYVADLFQESTGAEDDGQLGTTWLLVPGKAPSVLKYPNHKWGDWICALTGGVFTEIHPVQLIGGYEGMWEAEKVFRHYVTTAKSQELNHFLGG